MPKIGFLSVMPVSTKSVGVDPSRPQTVRGSEGMRELVKLGKQAASSRSKS
jgi:hypothetical protein